MSKFQDKPCLVCQTLFKPRSSQHKFCSPKCKGLNQYINGYASTENQYKRISQNWKKYLQRLLYKKDRRHLTVADLLFILERQNYKCALSGENLTCTLGLGMKHMTNASIDRIIPGGPYSTDNIRLVCRIVNIMKWNMSDSQFREWSSKVIKYGG